MKVFEDKVQYTSRKQGVHVIYITDDQVLQLVVVQTQERRSAGTQERSNAAHETHAHGTQWTQQDEQCCNNTRRCIINIITIEHVI